MEMQLADRGKEAKGFHSARTHAVERDGIKPGTLERIKIAAFAGFVGFLIGFVPAWFTSTGYQEELDSVVRTLRPSVLQNDLATATINARRGEYEQADRKSVV